MILEEATHEAFGYYPSDLTAQSVKSIIVVCELCGKFRLTTKNAYHTFCLSCALKGKRNCLGYKQTEEHKAKHSTTIKGERHHNYKGGKKLTWARCNARRKRDLGYILLNTYFEDCEGHHITHNFIIYIPKVLHKSVWHNLNTGQGMEAINALAFDFLVNGF